jgi:lysophospholipase L1-like esterase
VNPVAPTGRIAPDRPSGVRGRGPAVLAAALLAAAALAGCGDAGGEAQALQVVSLGDSLAVGVQPQLLGGARETRDGYPRQFASALRDRGVAVDLHELACGGATSASLLDGGRPCAPERDTPYRNEDPSTSQAAHALGLLSRRRDHDSVVLLDIGGNDVAACFSAGRIVPGCVARTGAALRRNLDALLGRLRRLDPGLPVGVLTLYDPLLGLWDAHPEARPRIAATHEDFRREVNGTIAAAARRHGATLVDLGGAMDQDAPVDPAAPERPAGVEAVCKLTWMCPAPPRAPDIHLRREGYALAAKTALTALSGALPRS